MILNIWVSSCLLSQPTVITFNQMQPVERDGRSMRSCRCEKWIYKENSSPIVL